MMATAPSPPIQWSHSLRQTFRLLPEPAPHLRPFLEADGKTPEELLGVLPYEQARSRVRRTGPNERRYRDSREVYETVGLLYEDGGRVHLTPLGRATLRWLDIINEKNFVLLARHAAYALAACQLVNPIGAGRDYDRSVRVFPFVFIWRAMLSLDGSISSDELNRAMLKVNDAGALAAAIDSIRRAREASDPTVLGAETVSGRAKNDRIIPWMSLASFGWTLIANKREGEDMYRIREKTFAVVNEAAQVRHRHRDFESAPEYVSYISACAALPEDLR